MQVTYHSARSGITHQRNVGIHAARGDILVFLDDDVDVAQDLFAALATAFEDYAVVGATGRVIERRSHRIVSQRSAIRRWLLGQGAQGTFTRFGYPRYVLDVDQPRDVETMPGCLMSVRTPIARQILFDETLEGYALAEDEDFSYRLSRQGRIRYVPHAVLEHKKSGYSLSDPREFNRQVVVNRAYLFRKNFPQSLLARAQFGLLIMMLVGHRLLNRKWSAAHGLVDGALEVWERKNAPRQ
jgi:GT2 family glycosyltransferase